jgi:gas vesicle protein
MDTRMQGNHTTHVSGFVIGLVAGSAIGAGVALYVLGPRLASALRQMTESSRGVRDATAKGVQAVATSVADVMDRVADVADDVTRKGQAVRDDVADAVAHGAHEVGRGAREIVRDAREVEQFATASKTAYKAPQS